MSTYIYANRKDNDAVEVIRRDAINFTTHYTYVLEEGEGRPVRVTSESELPANPVYYMYASADSPGRPVDVKYESTDQENLWEATPVSNNFFFDGNCWTIEPLDLVLDTPREITVVDPVPSNSVPFTESVIYGVRFLATNEGSGSLYTTNMKFEVDVDGVITKSKSSVSFSQNAAQIIEFIFDAPVALVPGTTKIIVTREGTDDEASYGRVSICDIEFLLA